jgi:hypothetical protein
MDSGVTVHSWQIQFVVVGETHAAIDTDARDTYAILVGPQVDVKERFFVGSA